VLREGGGEYQPYVELLDRLVEDAASSRREEVHRLLGDEAAVLARYVPGIERIARKGRPDRAPTLDPQGERARFLGSVSAFLDRCAAIRPRVVVVDDLHYADELSLDLTRHLAEKIAAIGPMNESGAFRLAPLSLIITTDPDDERADAANELVDELKDSQALLSVNLAPLDGREVAEMLQTMIGGGDVADVIGDVLRQGSGGVPGIVEERIRAWAASGELAKQGREWVLVKRGHEPPRVADDDDDVPTRSLPRKPNLETHREPSQVVELRAATRADIPIPDFDDNPAAIRVQRLPPTPLDLGERASILGERFSGAVLSRISLLSEDEFLDALDDLLREDILAEDPEDGWYRFESPDERQALIDELEDDRKEQLHRLVARALEDDAERTRRPVSSEVLSRHYLAAKELMLALEHLMKAARRALESSATQTAAERVREAQELFLKVSAETPFDPTMARRDLDLVLLRLDVLAAVGEHKECVALARRRLPRLRGSVDSRLVGEVMLRLAASERVRGEVDAALGHIAEVVSITERGGAHPLRCRAKSLCGLIYEQKGDYERSQRYYRDALELARTIDDQVEEENARMALASRHLETGELVIAEAELNKLLEAARARGERLRISRYINALGVIEHERGRLDEAEAAYREMIDLAKPAGDRRSVAAGLVNIGVVRRDQGRFADALNLCSKAQRIFTDIDDVEGLSYVRIIEAQTLLEKGDDEAALESGEAAVELAQRAGAMLRRAEADMCLALAQARTGEADAASEKLKEAIETARAVNANRVILFGLCALAETELLRGETAKSQRVVDEGYGRARRTHFSRFLDRLDALGTRLS
jgi:tetratricopeptide (TPR) repeat protein